MANHQCPSCHKLFNQCNIEHNSKETVYTCSFCDAYIQVEKEQDALKEIFKELQKSKTGKAI